MRSVHINKLACFVHHILYIYNRGMDNGGGGYYVTDLFFVIKSGIAYFIYIRQTKSYIDFQILVTEQLLRTKLHEMNVIHIGIGQQILK